MSYHCEHCEGKGQLDDFTFQVVEKFTCPYCRGSGRMRFEIYNFNLSYLKPLNVNKKKQNYLKSTLIEMNRIEEIFVVQAVVEFLGFKAFQKFDTSKVVRDKNLKSGHEVVLVDGLPILKIFKPVLYEKNGVFWQKRECEFLFDEGGSF